MPTLFPPLGLPLPAISPMVSSMALTAAAGLARRPFASFGSLDYVIPVAPFNRPPRPKLALCTWSDNATDTSPGSPSSPSTPLSDDAADTADAAFSLDTLSGEATVPSSPVTPTQPTAALSLDLLQTPDGSIIPAPVIAASDFDPLAKPPLSAVRCTPVGGDSANTTDVI
ncbi:hypothetical protein HGRIS_009817 [Hohenbuehelia grisea]|uniref:Secreted protein n=1 Tax=Hohenbuehelia grisea TaxID=104357 RepID=A0ABR3J2Q7_9AGAR